jgi:putative transposase
MLSLRVTQGHEGRAIKVHVKAAHFMATVILACVRRPLASPSYRPVEALMQERGASIDHATIDRWVVQHGARLEVPFHHRRRPVWSS